MADWQDEVLSIYKGESDPVFGLIEVDTNEYKIELKNTVVQEGTPFAEASIATQEEAEGGVTNNKLMTPLRVKQAVNSASVTSEITNCSDAFQNGIGYVDGSAVDYSDSVLDSQNQVNLQGEVWENLISNGDFSDGTTGWNVVAGALGVSNNILSLTSDGSSSVVTATTNFNLVLGDKYYYRARVRVTNSDSTKISFRCGNAQVDASINNPVINEWYTLSAVGIISALTTAVNVRVEYPSDTIANGKTSEIDGNYGVQVYNLTALGLDHLTETQCDELFHYIDGITDSGKNFRVKSVGKNISPINTIELSGLDPSTWYNPITFEKVLSSDYTTGYPIDIVEDNDYTLKAVVEDGEGLQVLNEDASEVLSYIATEDTEYLTSNRYYLRAKTDSSGVLNINSIQFEQGTESTDYEEYKESIAYFETPDILARVPNGTYNEIRKSANGGYEFVKRVKKHVLLSSEVVELNTSTPSNVDWAKIATLDNQVEFSFLTFEGKTLVENYPEKTYADSTENERTHFTSNFNQTINVVVPKGTYTDLAAAQADLAGTIIYYELAEPVITPLPDVLPISSFENGSTYIDPYIKKSYEYGADTSGRIDFEYAVLEIDKIIDINCDKVDSGDITLATDGSNVQITGAIDGEAYTVYALQEQSKTTKVVSVMDFDSNIKAQVESNNKAIQQHSQNILELQDLVDMLLIEGI